MVGLKKLKKMEFLLFENALRLHRDAIILFNQGSRQSAYFLSVISQEELGKMLSLNDHIFYEQGISEADRKQVWGDMAMQKMEREYFELLHRSHPWKQAAFVSYSWSSKINLRRIEKINAGILEKEKQRSLYVGLPKEKGKVVLGGRISTPSNLGKSFVAKQITSINDFFLTIIAGEMLCFYQLDSERISRLLNKNLYINLRKDWTDMGREAKSRVGRAIKASMEIKSPAVFRKKAKSLTL